LCDFRRVVQKAESKILFNTEPTDKAFTYTHLIKQHYVGYHDVLANIRAFSSFSQKHKEFRKNPANGG